MYQLALNAHREQDASEPTPNLADNVTDLLVGAMTLFTKDDADLTYRQRLFVTGAIHIHPLFEEIEKEIKQIYCQKAAENPSLSKIFD
jgi:hypothetical protein